MAENEAASVVQNRGNVPQEPTSRIDVFRWQKYLDGQENLWIVTCTFDMDSTGSLRRVELLNVAQEQTADFSRTDFESMVRSGTLRRVEPL
ncbi:hypothetical protein F5984_20605 [Rudanella paleaurantiibacter]|uniref:Uncharacterized protein n=1 Tax=Rudanella paleaurantiibacter TaxID=2614655 RepID=A0A7J5TVH0_9BACT|nr:hypothetical protein [Rudanella paleaurantiibacter]KAB7728149.1 hypothetical protein F5984_20605 [Rudanella paleaurantiibacter]